MEEFFYEKLEMRKDGQRMNNLECLGQAMLDASNEFGPGTPYGIAFLLQQEQSYLFYSAHL